MPEAHYIRYLPPKQLGVGEIVHAFSGDTPDLKEYKEANPDVFTREGFYTLMRATGQTLTIKGEKS